MIRAVVDHQVLRCRWVTCDAAFGRDSAWLDQVAGSGLWYFAEVPQDTRVWRQRPETAVPQWSGRGRKPTRTRLCPGQAAAEEVKAVAAGLPRAQWSRQLIKEGSKGPLGADFAVSRVVAVRAGLPGPEIWLVLRRNLETGELKTSVCNAPVATSLKTLVRLRGMRWPIGVSSEGHSVQSVEVRPRLKDSGLVAWEAPWRENKTVEPSDNRRRKAHAQHTRLQRAVNAAVASSHAIPVAETVDNARRQQGLSARSPIRQLSPVGYQRRHGVKETVSTGEALGVRRSNLAEEAVPITVRGKWRRRHQGGGSGRSTVDGRAAQRARREGPGPVSTPFVQVRQG